MLEKLLIDIFKQGREGRGRLSQLLEYLQKVELESGRYTPVPDDELDLITFGDSESSPSLDLESDTHSVKSKASFEHILLPQSELPAPLVITAVICTAFLLSAACIGVALYVVEIFKKNLFASQYAWDILPVLEKGKEIGA